MLKLFCFALLFLGSVAVGETVTLICPQVADVAISKQPYTEPWRAYGYQATIAVPGLTPFGDQLTLVGQGNETALTHMNVATWTDFSFLCWYQGDQNEIVVFSVVNFEDVFERCSFSADRYETACYSEDPANCPLTCELAQEE
jgi:hypothetical protein